MIKWQQQFKGVSSHAILVKSEPFTTKRFAKLAGTPIPSKDNTPERCGGATHSEANSNARNAETSKKSKS